MFTKTATPNLNLPQWDIHDHPDFLTDFNEAFRSIDDGYGGLHEAEEAHDQSIGELQSSVQNLKEMTDNLNETVSELDLGTIKPDIEQLKTDTQQLRTDVDVIGQMAEKNETDIGTLNSTVEVQESVIDDMKTDIATLETEMSSVKTRVNVAETNIITLTENLQNTTQRVATNESATAQNGRLITNLTGRVDTVEGTANTAKATAESAIDTANAAMDEAVEAKASADGANTAALGAQTAADNLIPKVTKNTSDIAEIGTEVDNIKSIQDSQLLLNQKYDSSHTIFVQDNPELTLSVRIKYNSGCFCIYSDSYTPEIPITTTIVNNTYLEFEDQDAVSTILGSSINTCIGVCWIRLSTNYELATIRLTKNNNKICLSINNQKQSYGTAITINRIAFSITGVRG